MIATRTFVTRTFVPLAATADLILVNSEWGLTSWNCIVNSNQLCGESES